MLSKSLIFLCIFGVIECMPDRTNWTTVELVYDRNVSLADILSQPTSNNVRLWSVDPLQKCLLVGCLIILILLVILFIVYVVLAIIDPERLNKLDFKPVNDDELKCVDRGANVCAIITYWCYCCLACQINAWMIKGARKLAELFIDTAKA